MQTIRITTTQNIDIDYEVAGLGERVVARIIDYSVFYGLYMIFSIGLIFTLKPGGGFTWPMFILVGIWMVAYVFYDLITEVFFNGQSLGKKIAKIKVVSLNGARPTIGQYLLRWIFRILDFGITLGASALLAVALTDNRQRVGDIAAGTTLVKTKPQTKFGDMIFAPAEEDHEVTYTEVSQLADPDITLIHDIVRNFKKTGNSSLVYKLALRIKEVLNIAPQENKNEYEFLEIIVKDYNYVMFNQQD